MIGEEDLKTLPSLKVKKWNAIRWLGRHKCLEALCGAYEYILDHLRVEMMNLKPSAKVTQTAAAELYRDLTSYENFLFFFLYRDFTEIMAIASKQLQARDLQISDVARNIIDLRTKLEVVYSKNIFFPETVTVSARNGNNILAELFQTKLENTNVIDSNSMQIISLIALEIKEMEDTLQLEAKEQQIILPLPVAVEALPKPGKETAMSNPSERRTRGVNAQSAWASLIPGTNKKSTAINEKRVHENTTIMPKEVRIVAAPAQALQNELDDDKLTKVYQ